MPRSPRSGASPVTRSSRRVRVGRGKREARHSTSAGTHLYIGAPTQDDICRWWREIDFQPPGGPPDIGRSACSRAAAVGRGRARALAVTAQPFARGLSLRPPACASAPQPAMAGCRVRVGRGVGSGRVDVCPLTAHDETTHMLSALPRFLSSPAVRFTSEHKVYEDDVDGKEYHEARRYTGDDAPRPLAPAVPPVSPLWSAAARSRPRVHTQPHANPPPFPTRAPSARCGSGCRRAWARPGACG